jgi:hypothetical protein
MTTTLQTLVAASIFLVTGAMARANPIAVAAPTSHPSGRLIIGGVPMHETPANYHRYIKHLTVPVARHSAPAFHSSDLRAIRSLENPVRRQIFDAMNQNRAETFAFATLKQAQENFKMRMTAIGFMFLVQKGRGNGVDFNYAGATVPQAADGTHWWHNARFSHVSRPGVAPAEAIDGIVRHKFRGECLGAMQINVLHAARVALGDARFNQLHSKGLDIGPKATSCNIHTRQGRSNRVADMVPGDWVYLKNKDDYGTDLRPGAPMMYWQGENALYLGRFEIATNGSPVYSSRAAQRFSGMGIYAKSDAEIRAAMKKAYLTDMRPPNTIHTHTISDSDIRWIRVDRLVTGR